MSPLDHPPAPDYGPLWQAPVEPAPHDETAEQALLGLLLQDPKHYDAVADLVAAADFYIPVHARIFSAITQIVARGGVPNPQTLHTHFAQEYDLKEAGGGDYLRAITESVFSAVNLTEYARLIRDFAQRRRLIEAAGLMTAKARGSVFEHPASAILEHCEATLFALSEDGQRPAQDMPGAIEATLQRIQKIQSGAVQSVKTGLAGLDRKTTGFWNNDLIILAGRPSMGKTALACTIAYNIAEGAKRVMVFELEMTTEQLMQRFFARLAQIPVGMQNRPDALNAEHFRELSTAGAGMRGLPLTIDDESGLTVHQIRARARRHKRRYGLDCVMIDYLGLIRVESAYGNKADQIGEITAALKAMAKELDVPVLVLHQLNRDVEKREDRRPTLADLRDSGHIEQDADAVIFLYRDEYYLEKNPPQQKDNEQDSKFAERRERFYQRLEQNKGKAELILAKMRQGETGVAEMRFNGPRQVFYDEE